MKGEVYCCYAKSAILYGSETKCLKEHKKAVLRMERAKVKAIIGRKVVHRKTIEEIYMLR